MKQKKENRVALLLHWAGEQQIWLFLAIFLSAVSGLCIIVPYKILKSWSCSWPITFLTLCAIWLGR
mgnify:CR=1 FL=1